MCFTNLSRDHLDYHASLDDYFETKARLFEPGFTAAAAVNLDDPRGAELARRGHEHGLPVTTYAVEADADVTATDVVVDPDGSHFTLVGGDATGVTVHTPLLGALNVSNALAAAVTARLAGFNADAVVAGIATVPVVPGRLERVETGQPFRVLVDYAHTPAALGAALAAARQLAGPHRVIVVFGAGGDRDPAKRPLMGRAAADAADVVIVTSDNPRSEDPAAIADAVLAGVSDGPARARRELDRRAAIRGGLDEARPGDVVLIAGKGHETVQQFADRTVGFDDRAVVHEELGTRTWN